MAKQRIGLALWLLMAAALCFFENNTGTKIVLMASILLPICSVLCAVWTARHASVSLHAPDACGEHGEAVLTCRLTGPWTRWGCAMQAEVCAVHRLTGREVLLTADQTCELTVDTACCGVIHFSVRSLTVTDWFGLCRLTCEAGADAEMTILPRCYPVTLMLTAPEASADAEARRSLPGSPDETIGLREYRPGDPVRLIHWKLSEKRDETLVRETGRSDATDVLLLLDAARRRDVTDDDIRGCVTALLSVVRALAAEGIGTTAALPDDEDLLSITCLDDADTLTDRVLRTTFAASDEPASARYASLATELAPRHIVLFSPSPETDAASLYQGRPVTLVLPPSAQGTAGSAEIAVAILDEEQAVLAL